MELDFILPDFDDYNLTLYVNLPMSDSPTNPPINETDFGVTPFVFQSPTIQTIIKRPGYTYAGSFSGGRGGHPSGSTGMYYYPAATWNYLNNNFIIDTWVYLPSSNITEYTFPWQGNSVTILDNAICGHGGPDTGGNVLAVGHPSGDLSNVRLRLYNILGEYVESSVLFPLDRWVHVTAAHKVDTLRTKLFIDDILVADDYLSYDISQGGRFGANFFIGGRDDNSFGGFNPFLP
jgi:hypothetical protein